MLHLGPPQSKFLATGVARCGTQGEATKIRNYIIKVEKIV